ncbi:MAG TPA: Imm1 family immunity protein [Pseudonocardiaceae bacterium]|nr:Imm1 family immunity protein [Pseudonocardiaceae bacterium]
MTTTEELDAFIDHVLADSAGYPVPPMIEASILGHPERGVMEIGLGPHWGFINLLSADGGITAGDTTRAGQVLYDYMGNTTEVDASAEIPLATVRQAIREFLQGDGTKPDSVSWHTSDQPTD